MLLSQQPEWLEAHRAEVYGDVETARQMLLTLIAKAQTTNDTSHLGFIFQTLENMEARAGNFERVTQLHEQAIALDSEHPMEWLIYAKGLWRAFGDKKSAIVTLTRANEVMNDCDRVGFIDEPSRSYYLREFDNLREKINRNEC